MINDELEQLLNRYMQGDIDTLAFRRGRQMLIDSFVNTDITKPEHKADDDTTQNLKPLNLKNDLTSESAFNIPILDKKSGSNFFRVVMYVGVAVAVIIAGLLVFQSSDPSSSISKKLDPVETAANNEPKEIPTEPFITEFVTQNEWSTETLSNFLVSWQNLSMEKQANARKSKGFQELKITLSKQIESLKTVSSAKERTKQEKLLDWFSRQMAIDLNQP